MAKIVPLSGFPEWPPELQMAERTVLAQLRHSFELHGFLPLETRSVEPLEHLLAKGATDKEVYMLRRLQAGDDEKASDLGLHFDLTVPFARYVAEFNRRLPFPFRRYQVQKSWRGERPQEGRYREFYQADVDVIGDGTLSIEHDADVLAVIDAVLSELPIPPVRLMINNRKIMAGFFASLDIDDSVSTLRVIDKLDKIGRDQVRHSLVSELGLSPTAAESCLALSTISGDAKTVSARIAALGHKHPLLQEGLDELTLVMSRLKSIPKDRLVADLHIARGLDYYTGTVVESVMLGHEDLGSVCSGGRYDNLASMGGTRIYPGVGVSIGVSRILGRLFRRDALKASRTSPSCVLVAMPEENHRETAVEVAANLRSRGIPCELYVDAVKYAKQIRHADRLGIPYVWFVDSEGGGHAVRDLKTGQQDRADSKTWTPAAIHERVRLV